MARLRVGSLNTRSPSVIDENRRSWLSGGSFFDLSGFRRTFRTRGSVVQCERKLAEVRYESCVWRDCSRDAGWGGLGPAGGSALLLEWLRHRVYASRLRLRLWRRVASPPLGSWLWLAPRLGSRLGPLVSLKSDNNNGAAEWRRHYCAGTPLDHRLSANAASPTLDR